MLLQKLFSALHGRLKVRMICMGELQKIHKNEWLVLSPDSLAHHDCLQFAYPFHYSADITCSLLYLMQKINIILNSLKTLQTWGKEMVKMLFVPTDSHVKFII